jgi:trehalose-phosphatase
MSTVEHETATHSRLATIAASVRSSELLGDLAEASRELDPALFRRLFELSRSPSLLVATDYDGTIAPIVDVPSEAFPLESSVDSLRALALLPSTSAGVISGRSLRDLAAMSRLPREVHLFGSHGGETDTFTINALDEAQRATLAAFRAELTRVLPDEIIEHKTTGAAVHLRGLDETERLRIESAVAELAAAHPIHPTRGKQVIDLSVVPSSKAEALTRLRAQTDVESVVFIGDDTADEFALETLGRERPRAQGRPRVRSHPRGLPSALARRGLRGPRGAVRAAQILALRPSGHSDPAAQSAGQRAVDRARRSVRKHLLDAAPPAPLGLDVLRDPRLGDGRLLRRRPRLGSGAPDPALHRQFDPARDAVGGPELHRLPRSGRRVQR